MSIGGQGFSIKYGYNEPPEIEVDNSHPPMTETELEDRAKYFARSIFGVPYNYKAQFVKDEDIHGGYGAITLSGEAYDDEHYVKIEIYEKMKSASYIMLDSTLIHELLHYYLWYLGLDDGDSSRDFITRANKLGICVNDDSTWSEEKKRWLRAEFDKTKMEAFESAYQQFKADGKFVCIEGDWR